MKRCIYKALLFVLLITSCLKANELSYIYDNNIWIASSDFSTQQSLLNSPRNSITNLKWSPDGMRLGFISENGLEVYDFDDNTIHVIGDYDKGMGGTVFYDWRSFDWSPNGTKLIAGKLNSQNNRQLFIIPYDNPQTAIAVTPASDDAYLPSWSPNGEKIMYYNKTLQTAQIILNDGSSVIGFPATKLWGWTFDGSYIIISSLVYGQVVAVDASSGTKNIIDDSVWIDAYNWPKPSPTANKVAYTHLYLIGGTAAYYEARISDIYGTSEGFGWRIGGDNIYVYTTSRPNWSPSGDKCLLYDVDAGSLEPVHLLTGTPGNTSQIAVASGVTVPFWSPDGNYILSARGLSGLSSYVFDLTSGIQSVLSIAVVEIIWRPQIKTSLTLKDANEDALADKEFYLIRVVDDAPNFTPDTLGIVKTDADGKIQLTPLQ